VIVRSYLEGEDPITVEEPGHLKDPGGTRHAQIASDQQTSSCLLR
jgi:hypothetical protein